MVEVYRGVLVVFCHPPPPNTAFRLYKWRKRIRDREDGRSEKKRMKEESIVFLVVVFIIVNEKKRERVCGMKMSQPLSFYLRLAHPDRSDIWAAICLSG